MGAVAGATGRRESVPHLRCSGVEFGASQPLRAGLTCGAPAALRDNGRDPPTPEPDSREGDAVAEGSVSD